MSEKKLEPIKLDKPLYPKLVTDLASQNHYLKILSYSLIGLSVLLIILLAFSFRKGVEVIALDPTGTVASVSQELHSQHVESAVKEYLQHRYTWTPETIQSELKKAEAFIQPSLTSSFQKSMVEVQKFVKDKKVTQRIYPQKIEVSLKEKTVVVIADRITDFDSLKGATTLRTKINFDLDSPTNANPWGIFFTKETENGDLK